MKVKMINKLIMLIVILILFLVFNTRISYGSDYDEAEFTDDYPDYGGTTVTPTPTPETPVRDDPSVLTKTTYVRQTNTLEGSITERIEAIDQQELGGIDENGKIKDSSNNISDKGIEGLKVQLYMDGSYRAETTTDSSGKYVFSTYGLTGLHRYHIEFTYPSVTDSDINNINSVEEAKKIQKKLKYNSQDYLESAGNKQSIIETYGKGMAQVFILLDCSVSMNQEIVVNGEKITKLELEKRIATKLVQDLLGEDKNIVIGLIVFRGQVYRKVSLTNDKEKLINAINGNIEFTSTGYTNIVGALNKAKESFANNNKDNSNRYIFILSDGLPTSDGSTKVWKVSGDADRQARIRAENATNLKLIAENTSKKLEEVEEDGITVFSAISTEGMSEEGLNTLNNIYQNNKNIEYNKFLAVNSIEELLGNQFVKDLKTYVRDSVRVIDTGYTIDESTRGDNIKDNFGEFKNSNTAYFEALDMDINSDEDIMIFKEYAKKIIETSSKKVKTSESTAQFIFEPLPAETTVTHYKDNSDEVDYYEVFVIDQTPIFAPNAYLDRLPQFELTPRITITDAKVTNAQNNIIKELSTTTDTVDDRNRNLYMEIHGDDLYGGEVSIEYTVELVNKSIFNNMINNIGLFIYVPENFTFESCDQIATVIDGITNSKKLKVKSKVLNMEDIEKYKESGYLPQENGAIEKYIKEGHSALIVIIENENKETIPTNAKLQFKMSAIKLISGREYDDPYDGNVEIITYSNTAYRRLLYNSNLKGSTTVQASGIDGAVAGNKDGAEEDMAESNKAVVLTPTGENKSTNKIIITIVILTITASILFIIKKKRYIRK